jgi:hypothetical protein
MRIKCVVCHEMFDGEIGEYLNGKLEVCEECRRHRKPVVRGRQE